MITLSYVTDPPRFEVKASMLWATPQPYGTGEGSQEAGPKTKKSGFAENNVFDVI
jgi:hypothetical protein